MNILLFLFATLLPLLAQANIGIPIVSYGLPFLLLNLVFVVGFEVLVLKKFHREIPLGLLVKQVSIANLFTTLIAYPLVAILLAMSTVFGMNMGWLLPFDDLTQMSFYVGSSTLLTLIPCYFLSVWIEGRGLRRKLPVVIRWKYHYLAHAVSYAFLILQIYTVVPGQIFRLSQFTIKGSFQFVATLALWLANLK